MSSPQKKYRVFLVDDHPLVRESLTNLINQQPDLSVCGEAEDTQNALAGIVRWQPDVAIVDVSLKTSSGIELIRLTRAKTPNVATIALSMHDERIYAERAIRAGARGYVMKGESTKRIIGAIRQVLQGGLALSEPVAAAFAERFVSRKQVASEYPQDDLSDRELEVFTLLGRGFETRQVAEKMNVSIKTVQAYCARIKQKRNLASATELLREAILWNERQVPD